MDSLSSVLNETQTGRTASESRPDSAAHRSKAAPATIAVVWAAASTLVFAYPYVTSAIDLGFLVPPLFWGALLLVLLGAAKALAGTTTSQLGLWASVAALLLTGAQYLPEHFKSWGQVSTCNTPPHQVTVLTANLGIDPQAIPKFAKLVAEIKPQIILLQEASEPRRSALSHLDGYRFAAGCKYPSQCNAAILTTLPIASVIEPDGSGFVAAKLSYPAALDRAEPIVVASLHLSRGQPNEQRRQIKALEGAIAGVPSTQIFGGDLNLTPWSPLMRKFEFDSATRRWTRDFATWPGSSVRLAGVSTGAAFPVAAIDHIFTRGAWRLISGPDRFDFGSDHYAVSASFGLHFQSECPASPTNRRHGSAD